MNFEQDGVGTKFSGWWFVTQIRKITKDLQLVTQPHREIFQNNMTQLKKIIHHKSAVWSYGDSFISSGAMYNGVPLMEVRSALSFPKTLAKPKSQSLAESCESRRTLDGFKSLK